MNDEAKSKGRWIHRFAIRFFTLILAVLVYWVLGFFVDDLRSVKGPDYKEIEKNHVSAELLSKHNSLKEQIKKADRAIANEKEKQRIVGDSSRNLQQTINQLLELQKRGIEKSVAFSETEQKNFSNSLKHFLDNQQKYQALSQSVADMVETKQNLERLNDETLKQIEKQREPARREYESLRNKHRIRQAFLQLGVLLPILAVAVAITIMKRVSLYFPLFLAFGGAALLKVALVVHEYFPTRYFKYILIGGLLIAVTKLLIYFIRSIAFPKTEWLVKQYREGYERFLCPVCEYPIRTGPRRFLYWTRRTVNKILVPGGADSAGEEGYTCPSCGKTLFEECASCHKVRHALLPNCRHCGAEKEIQ